MKSKIADYIDTVLLFVCLSVLGIISARYFTRNLPIIFISGLTSGLALTFLIGLFKSRKRLPKQKQKLLDDTRNQFVFSSKDENEEFIYNALAKKYSVRRDCGYIIAGCTAVSVNLSFKPVDMAALAEGYSSLRGKTKRLIFLTAFGCDKQVADMVKSLPQLQVEIFEFGKVFDLLRKLDSLPENKLKLKSGKSNIKAIAVEAFAVSKAKRYLLAALLLLLSSLFMPFGIYYLVMASLLITFAVLCRIDIVRLFKGKTKKEKDRS